jgi:predicted ATPase/class 3 adenylate cyclase
MSDLPTGTVTFLFTDVEGSTQRWEHYHYAMKQALSRHNSIMRQAIAANNGLVYETAGDSFVAVFSAAPDALRAALAAQRALHAAEWEEPVGRLKVRMALHTGSAEMLPDGYNAHHTLSRLARVLACAYGDQVLLSLAAHELVRDDLPSGVELRDMGEHRLKDLIRPERIYQVVIEGLPFKFPPLRTLDNRPHNLPVQSTPFIGREKEISKVVDLLRGAGVRLVTLTGPGGTGKTRLSLQVAAEMLEVEDSADGVYFVEVAALTDPALVLTAIAQALGVADAGDKPLQERVQNYLRDKRLLLVLDNMEQVLGASPTIAALLKGAAGLKVLATSRVPLRIHGEKEYPVPSMQLPDMSALPALERLTQCEAVRLFIERARDVKPDFEVTNESAPAVAEICVRLDGLPLAIELAAARTKLFPPQALLSRLSTSLSSGLSGRLKLLTGGSRDLPERQQTLRGAIEWSYDLLEEEAKQHFWRMAPFSGGSTLDALEAVCNYDGQLLMDVVDGVQSLVDKSLLQQREGERGGADGEPRFWMLETIHEYALEKLHESGEEEDLRRAHAHYFASFVADTERILRGPQQQEWLLKLEQEHDNLRAVLSWAYERARNQDSKDSVERDERDTLGTLGSPGSLELGLRLSWALHTFWRVKGYLGEGRAQLERFLDLANESGYSGESVANTLGALGVIARLQGDYTRAMAAFERELDLGKELGDNKIVASATFWIGTMTAEAADLAAAGPLFEQSLQLYRELGDKRGMASVLNNLGRVAFTQGDPTAARGYYEESRAMFKALGHKWGLSAPTTNLGHVEYWAKNYAAASSLYKEDLTIGVALGSKVIIAVSIGGLGGVAAEMSQAEKAARLLGAADALVQTAGAAWQNDDRVPYDRGLELARAQLGEDAFEKVWQEGRAMSMEQAVEYALEGS